MISGPSNREAFDRHEPIPGYRTTELLGRGGYGEVWKAIAPGGISKAVKIIYGDADSSKAEGELRALARIKDVRHPMILSIDRIEQQSGVLVIVMELGDCNLKEHFHACRKQLLPGIPQKELLVFLRDAADALDFIYDEFAVPGREVYTYPQWMSGTSDGTLRAEVEWYRAGPSGCRPG